MATLQERIDAALLLVGSDIGDLANTLNQTALETTQNDIKDLSQQVAALNDTMLYFVTAILEKMPRLDINDRAAVSIETGTLPTLTNVQNINNLGGGNANFLPYQIANVGALHIYDNIKVS